MTRYQTKSITQPMEFIGEDSLSHHGILGMKWGVRRYQNPDGTLTAEGRKRYRSGFSEAAGRVASKVGAKVKKVYTEQVERSRARKAEQKAKEDAERAEMQRRMADAAKTKKLMDLYNKNPNLLTNQELSDLNNRVFTMKKINENSPQLQKTQKNGEKAVEKSKNALVTDVIAPGVVALGKSAVMSMVGGGDFQKIASVQLDKAYNGKNQNQGKNNDNDKNQDKKKFAGFEFKVKRE